MCCQGKPAYTPAELAAIILFIIFNEMTPAGRSTAALLANGCFRTSDVDVCVKLSSPLSVPLFAPFSLCCLGTF